MEILDATIKSTAAIDGDCTVSYSADTVIPHLGIFTMPGAYAEIEITVQNKGSTDAKLLQVDAPYCSLEDFSVTLADNLEGETLQAGDTCTLTTVVMWNKRSSRSFAAQTQGDYRFRLVYTADGFPDPVPDFKSSKTTAATADAATGQTNKSAIQTGEAATLFFLLPIAMAAAYTMIRLKAK